MTDKNSNLSVEYLIDLISSIKSALGNIDNNNKELQTLLSDLSENFTVLSELNKRQYQDSKETAIKLDLLSKSVDEINLAHQLDNKDIYNMVSKLQDGLSILSVIKEKNLETLQDDISEIKTNLKFIADKLMPINTIDENRSWLKRGADFFSNLHVVTKSAMGIFISIMLLLSALQVYRKNPTNKIAKYISIKEANESEVLPVTGNVVHNVITPTAKSKGIKLKK
jgi:hypothetical protein